VSDALLREAIAHHTAGRLHDAGVLYARILAADPDNADALHLSGLVAYKQGRFDEAIALVRQAIARAPRNATFHGNLGNIEKDAGRRDDAIATYRRTLALDPAQVPARNNLGVLLLEGGEADRAIEAFRDVLARKPDHFRAHANLGKALIAAGDPTGAEAALRRALELEPRFAEALGDLGLLQQRHARRDEAIALFRRRVDVEPESSVAHADLALALHQSGDAVNAAAEYACAASLAPLSIEATCNWCALLQKTCDWETLAMQTPRVMQALADGAPGVPVGLTVSLPGVTARMQLAAARNNAARFEGRPPIVGRRTIDPSRRLRIGYLSADFRAHATAWVTSEVFELHDRARHEVVLISYGPDDGSAERARLIAAADVFVDVANASDREAAMRIADAGIDVLVDLNGATDNGRMGIAAWRPTLVQVNWMGFPGTLGATFYDYQIADRHVVPPGEEADYAEKVVRLPDCYWCNDSRRPRPVGLATRAAAGLPRDAAVLCCFNQSYKLTPDVFAVWMRTLASVPETVLWLYADNPLAIDSLRRRARDAGVDPERLYFARQAPQAEHLARYALADLAVDTFPCTSHTTACDALWMGCPLATITGNTFAARVATSLLVSAGLPDLATRSLADYEAMLLALARDPGRRAALRRRAATAASTAPLFDTPRFVRNLEAAYAAMAVASAGAAPAAPSSHARIAVDAVPKNVL